MRCCNRLPLVGALLFAAPGFAGAFVTLPLDGSRVNGTNNPGTDPLFIAPGAVSGPFTNPETGVTLNAYDFPNNFTLLATRTSEIELPDEDNALCANPSDPGCTFEEVGEYTDVVLQDGNDGKLVFGSRIVLEGELVGGIFEWEEGELNDIIRSGFEGFSAAVAWTFGTDFDLRMVTAARTGDGLLDSVESDDTATPFQPAFDPDKIDMFTDINGEEGNAYSGWFLVKTDAPGFVLAEEAISLRQAGEEGQAEYTALVDGFVPVPVPAALPMLLSGIAALGTGALRRRRA